ncbi:serine--tRNA ligase [Candidatus Campbellbacteria bacterium RIFOXYC2_FULL_35_25]|uniref:Serine--tRNA ligase n=1 Tax=Candidatus Campbellbacteria bacterium RIFOXYC2_FULL_35_25 TaxID=1797582 RepID=A0A1F5EIZ7_9BACT|nr:MAG: serine--tRNA ligase [Candidatus Campbellbacteria bacterium RIFOXYC2_FULL_35_25]
MLDIKFIRENKDLIQSGAKKKHIDFDVNKLLEVDDKRKEIISKVDEMRAEQNLVTDKISLVSENERGEMIEKSKEIKANLQKQEETMKEVMKEWQLLMLQVPNIPDMSVPDGVSDEENQEIKSWGEKTRFDFEPKSHVDIMTNLEMVDFERGSKIHGFRGYYLLNDGARLSWAIWNYANEFFGQKGFIPMLPPAIVKKENLYGTGHLPNDAEDVYNTQDDDYLIGTAEIPVTGFHSGEVLKQEELPKKYLGFSPCFRREAGSYGKDTKGLIRVQEFYKVEQVILCEASHQESVKWHEWINRNTEEFIESLGIPYHTVINCGGDLGQGQVKKYDIELWVPLENKYREISSASYFHDFQARRFNIKYKDQDGKSKYVHTLNSTAIPTPRILVSLVENFQQADGSIKIPEVLRKYMNKEIISKEK